MLTAFKTFLKYKILVPGLYFFGVVLLPLTAFKKVWYGLCVLIALIPQPNIWYKFHDYPYGKDFLDYIFIAILVGIVVQKKGLLAGRNFTLILVFLGYSYITVIRSAIHFRLPMPFSYSSSLLVEWKNFAQMVLLYILTVNIVKKEEHQKILLIIICLVVLFVSVRNFRNFSAASTFSYDRRAGGPFEFVELGANHFGAFIAYCWAVMIGICLGEQNKKLKLLFLITSIVALHPIFFAYSRGVYVATVITMCLFGVLKKRGFLVILLVIFLAWETILPASVVDRITMTRTDNGELEESASERLVLWDRAVELYEKEPIFGVGYDSFRINLERNGKMLTDTHNYYLKVLCEQGIVGLSLFGLLLCSAFYSGFKLYRNGKTEFNRYLGFGFMGCVLSLAISNIFGDRFSYFVMGSYFWVFWGLVDRGLMISGSDDFGREIVAESKDMKI